MPFFPSPLKDDGYDIAEYTTVHPNYGNLEDFKLFLNAAHERNIRVIVEMVLNHTSDQHAWFQESRSSRDNPRRDWYVWSDTDTKYQGVRIIFVDTELSNWAWTRFPRPTTGIAFSATSPISTTTIPPSAKRCGR